MKFLSFLSLGLFPFLLVLVLAALSGCNTIEGIGDDISGAARGSKENYARQYQHRDYRDRREEDERQAYYDRKYANQR